MLASRVALSHNGTMWSQMVSMLVGAVLSVSFVWLVGNTLAARLEREKKVTERDSAALTSFQETYGKFFSAWKQWSASDKGRDAKTKLLAEAAEIEGRFEALLVMVCSERCLTGKERDILGAMRQGFQQLREAIKLGQNVEWRGAEVTPYVAFKSLSVYVAVMLSPRVVGWAGRSPRRPTAAEAASAILHVTANRFEYSWADIGKALER